MAHILVFLYSLIGLRRSKCNTVLLHFLLPGSIRACRAAALKCDEFKFQQYQSLAGARLTPEVQQQMQSYLDKIKVLEH